MDEIDEKQEIIDKFCELLLIRIAEEMTKIIGEDENGEK